MFIDKYSIYITFALCMFIEVCIYALIWFLGKKLFCQSTWMDKNCKNLSDNVLIKSLSNNVLHFSAIHVVKNLNISFFIENRINISHKWLWHSSLTYRNNFPRQSNNFLFTRTINMLGTFVLFVLFTTIGNKFHPLIPFVQFIKSTIKTTYKSLARRLTSRFPVEFTTPLPS